MVQKINLSKPLISLSFKIMALSLKKEHTFKDKKEPCQTIFVQLLHPRLEIYLPSRTWIQVCLENRCRDLIITSTWARIFSILRDKPFCVKREGQLILIALQVTCADKNTKSPQQRAPHETTSPRSRVPPLFLVRQHLSPSLFSWFGCFPPPSQLPLPSFLWLPWSLFIFTATHDRCGLAQPEAILQISRSPIARTSQPVRERAKKKLRNAKRADLTDQREDCENCYQKLEIESTEYKRRFLIKRYLPDQTVKMCWLSSHRCHSVIFTISFKELVHFEVSMNI